LEALLEAEAVAKKAPDGPPPVKDHRKANNPYLLQFGPKEWNKEVLKTPTMKAITNVCERRQAPLA
jgi:hypothetical protein